MEKLNLTQQKRAFTNQKKCSTTQNKQKNKAMFSRLLPHPARKWRGPILVSLSASWICHLLTCLDIYPLTYSPDPHGAFHPVKPMTHELSRRALSFGSRLDGRRDGTPCHTTRLDHRHDGRQDGCQKNIDCRDGRHDGPSWRVVCRDSFSCFS